MLVQYDEQKLNSCVTNGACGVHCDGIKPLGDLLCIISHIDEFIIWFGLGFLV